LLIVVDDVNRDIGSRWLLEHESTSLSRTKAHPVSPFRPGRKPTWGSRQKVGV
jgi:hypothetical protein